MVGEKVKFDSAAAAKSGDEQKHERSSIAFPYLDLDAAVEVANAVYSRSGHGACDIDELAAEMKQTVSGAFRMKTATAKIFDVIDKDGRSAFRLSDLGQKLVSPNGEAAARVQAFLSVPLYKAIYEQYKGHLLPPSKALEREIQRLGVSSKQTDKARQAFERSARQAGFFAAGDDRLVKPRLEGVQSGEDREQSPTKPTDNSGASQEQGLRRVGGGSGSGGGYHPFIEGLLQTLPEPGTLWTIEGRAAWLQAAAYNFTLIYKGEGHIDVHATQKKEKPTS